MEERGKIVKENRYPLFEGKRVLKKEMLWALRDYLFAHVYLEYQEYEPGIIQGSASTHQATSLRWTLS